MRSHRGGGVGSWWVAAALVLMPATARAQPGFGPDPFWPYNNQYTPYVTNIGPALPEGGQGGMPYYRDGLRGSNQYQEYLDSLEGASGPGRNLSDRSSIGLPYYRSAVDPGFDTRARGGRQYIPNARTRESFDDSQRRVANAYLRYFSERDPSRRAELLREYRQARREADVAISGRGRSPSRVSDRPADSRRGARAGSPSARGGAAGRDRADRIGPAPEVPFSTSSRRSAGAATRRPLPSDVLNRSRAMGRSDRARPGAGTPDALPGASPAPRGAFPRPPSPSSSQPAAPSPPPAAADNP